MCTAALNDENAAAPLEVISAEDAAQVSADASKQIKETKYGETRDDACAAVLSNEDAAAQIEVILAKGTTTNPDHLMLVLSNLLMEYKEAEFALGAAQDSVNGMVNGFRCCEMWSEYSFALDAADVAQENVDSAREALSLELKASSLKVQAMTDVKQNIKIRGRQLSDAQVLMY